jgi:hypothetical protein
MTKMNANAKHMKQTARKSNKGRIVAVALAGVLTMGGVAGAVCVAGLGKMPTQAPVAAQVAGTTSATKTAAAKQSEAKPETGKAETKKASATKKSETKPTEKSSAKKAEAKKEVAKPAVKKAEAKSAAKQTAKKTEEKPAAKPAAKTAEAKPASKPTTKKAEAKPAAQQVQKQAPKQAEAKSDCGLQAKISREECIRKACAHVSAGGQAKGPALNVTARQVTGGGTVYYVVELDLGDVHYAVQVDAIDGSIISADQVHAGKRVLLDKQANPVEGTEQEA